MTTLAQQIADLESRTEAELDQLMRTARTREQMEAAERVLVGLRRARLRSLLDQFHAATARFVALADELQRVVDAVEARPPSRDAVQRLTTLAEATSTAFVAFREPERLASATDPGAVTIATPVRDEEEAPPARIAPPPESVAEVRLPPINASEFPRLRDEYAAYFAAAKVRREWEGDLAFYLRKIKDNRPRYEAVGEPLGIPWHFIGCIHALESGFNFQTHLFNGDPLTGRTTHVPRGQPEAPPINGRTYTWEESARAAMVFKGFHRMTDWSLPRVLYRWEAYNGFGYRPQGVPTPYLWSFSNLYERGRYVADHRFDPNAVSKQAGAAILLRMLIDDGAASLPSG